MKEDSRYGLRGRFGLVCPAIYDTQALEFAQLLPKGVMVVITTLNIQNLVEAEFERAFSIMEQGALMLAREEVGAIIVGGDPVFCREGLGSHQRMIDAVYAKTGIPTTTTLSVSMDALKSLKIKRLVIASPFVPKQNEAISRYLEASGFEVLASKGLGITRNTDSSRLPLSASYQVCVDAFNEAKGAEGIYIPCPRWPVMGNIDPLEKELGVPVISHINAMTWWALESLGIKEQIKGYGILLERSAA